MLQHTCSKASRNRNCDWWPDPKWNRYHCWCAWITTLPLIMIEFSPCAIMHLNHDTATNTDQIFPVRHYTFHICLHLPLPIAATVPCWTGQEERGDETRSAPTTRHCRPETFGGAGVEGVPNRNPNPNPNRNPYPNPNPNPRPCTYRNCRKCTAR